MRLKNFLIVVRDLEKSTKFYGDLFSLKKVTETGGTVVLTDGLVLQDGRVWSDFLGKEVIPKNNAYLLYFEEDDLEGFIERLEGLYPSVDYVNRLMTNDFGKKVVRFYDLDGNLIEVASPK